jgi:UPF0755 protein
MRRGATRAVTIAVTVVAVVVVAVVGGRRLANWAGGLGGAPDVTAPAGLIVGSPVTVDIPKGSTARQIGVLLAERGIVSSAVAFELAVRSAGVAEQLQAGTYDLRTGMAAGDALDLLLAGPVDQAYRITVREGLRVGEILDSLAEQTPYSSEEFEQALGAVTSTLGLGGSDPVSWEGGLFPDTYEISADASPAEILQRLATTMEERVGSIDWSALNDLGYDVRDGIVIASMVEAEAKLDEDRPLIASVVVNRLKIGMPLQIDATVLYALGERGVALTSKDLEVDSPYNTYVYGGLPPTPISAPGVASLRAAAAPAVSDYLYYVLTDSSGGHSFAATYEEFLAYKEQARRDGVIP